MTREEAHELIDQMFNLEQIKALNSPEVEITPEVKKEHPEGQRVVRTKTSGDKVYLLDDNKNTRSWITTGEVLTGLGFTQADVVEVPDTELFKYTMSAALYKAPDATS